jgi:hypothetical protein
MEKELGHLEWEGQNYTIKEDEAGVFTQVKGERCRVRSLGRQVSKLPEGGTVEVMHPTRQEVLFWGRLLKHELSIEIEAEIGAKDRVV